MIFISPKTINGLSRAAFRATTTPRRSLTHLTMGFAEITAWKKARRLAAAVSPSCTSSTPSSPAPPATTTMLHSAVVSPPLPRRHPTPEPRPTDERSASEILDVPSLHVLGKLHAGSRPSAPVPAPATPAPDKNHGNKAVPKSSLASGLEALRRLGEGLSRRAGKTGSGSSGTPGLSVAPAPVVGGVQLDGGVATASASGENDQRAAVKERGFPRELPMFLGGGLY
ncbi:hypothetical protein B0T18DRAFT_76672 [Schizothecium vesticola]|uniref:Uncharacterized protein n=1 Tax=Schizothecium vesticola TaxID=314040 RepID=A0AA40F6J1_9PEZI|nr:hypothetical protein B0T18DRAFT_76672 [Schizothecium vesticola]